MNCHLMNLLQWCFLMFFFKDYLDSRKLRLWDFFRNIDKDSTMRVPVTDFRKAVQVSKRTDDAENPSKLLWQIVLKLSSHVKRDILKPIVWCCVCVWKILALNHSFESVPDWGADSEAWSWRDRNSGLQVNMSLTVWSYTQILNRFIVGLHR